MSEEIIIVNDEPFYRMPNGTSYKYAPIPKEFKPYFERLQQENQQLRNALEKLKDSAGWREILELAGIIQERDKLQQKNNQLKEVIEQIKISVSTSKYAYEEGYQIDDAVLDDILQILDKVKEGK